MSGREQKNIIEGHEVKMKNIVHNPVINLDYPDPEVIRVGDTYYMTTTSVHLHRPSQFALQGFEALEYRFIRNRYQLKITRHTVWKIIKMHMVMRIGLQHSDTIKAVFI